MRSDTVPGAIFPNYELPDHTAKHRKLSELQGQHPMVLVLSRGGFCPKDRRQAELLVQLHLEFAVELNKQLSLPAVLGAESSAAEHENHGMLSLQFGEFPVFRGVVGKFIVREDSSWNRVRSHINSSMVRFATLVYARWSAGGVLTTPR